MMKKLFTLFALLTCFLGANAKEIVDAEVDFSKYTDIADVPFASWRGSESAFARLSLKDGCLHFESTEATDPGWDCQFFPIGGVSAELDVVYTLHFKIKGDHEGNVSMLGFGQTPYGQFPITTEWVEGTVDYQCTAGGGGDILMQCGDWIGSWDIAYLKITHEGKEEKPIEWIPVKELVNGDAESAWPDWALKMEGNINPTWRGENSNKVCAYSLTMGTNFDDQCPTEISADSYRARPYPTTIEAINPPSPRNAAASVAATAIPPRIRLYFFFDIGRSPTILPVFIFTLGCMKNVNSPASEPLFTSTRISYSSRTRRNMDSSYFAIRLV